MKINTTYFVSMVHWLCVLSRVKGKDYKETRLKLALITEKDRFACDHGPDE